MNNTINLIRKQLQDNSDETVKRSTQTFFKDQILCYGIKSATVTKIGKESFKSVKQQTKEELFSLCTELWQSGYVEESFIACQWTYNLRKEFTPDDLKIFENWIDTYITNWASCDTFCNHTVGTFIEMYPQYITKLKDWAVSNNRWMRRAAAVSLIVPAKKGLFLKDIFEIAEILLVDNEDMVQKGYGWMLKVASNKHEKEIFDYIMAKKAVMPRTALRYAIEKMSVELKKQAMAK